jgi:hypothetical protein
MNRRLPHRFASAVALLVTFAACDRRSVTEPGAIGDPSDLPAGAVLVQCAVDLRAGEMRCDAAEPEGLGDGIRADRIIGGQDRYVRVWSTGTGYDAGTEILSATVQLQNLTEQYMGTTDGATVDGVKIFFHSGPTVTSGSGTVTVSNPDGTDTFTASGQPYFAYRQILSPMEISEGELWMFQVPPTVGFFVFTVYVSAPMVDESAVLLGPVWTGGAETADWFTPGNWDGGVVPDSTMVATIPTDSLLGEVEFPVLTADARVQHLRVGAGSMLDLDGRVIEVRGNVDATGDISNGTVRLANGAEFLGGNVPSVQVGGGVALQRPVRASGPVSVTGSLQVGEGVPLNISIP